MEYRSFGRTGMRVSVVGLGCGGFGGIGSVPELFGKGEDKASAFALMDRAWAAGINYFDTADSYGGGFRGRLSGVCSRSAECGAGWWYSPRASTRTPQGPTIRGFCGATIWRASKGG